MCSLDFLKPDNEFGLAPRIAIRVILQRKRSESLAYLVFGGGGRDLQVGIVVSRGIGFDHGCGDSCLVKEGERS